MQICLKAGKIQYENNVAVLLCGTSVCPFPWATSNFVKQCSAVLNLPFLGCYLQDGLLQLEWNMLMDSKMRMALATGGRDGGT